MGRTITIILMISVSAFIFCNNKNDDNHNNDLANLKFPELKPVGGLPDGYIWKFEDGPDFYLYYGTNLEDDSSGIGIYFGLHPDFSIPEDAEKDNGKVGAREVTWVIYDNYENYNRRYYFETLFEYKHDDDFFPISIHLWIYSNSDEELENLLKSLEKVRFEEREL